MLWRKSKRMRMRIEKVEMIVPMLVMMIKIRMITIDHYEFKLIIFV